MSESDRAYVKINLDSLVNSSSNGLFKDDAAIYFTVLHTISVFTDTTRRSLIIDYDSTNEPCDVTLV